MVGRNVSFKGPGARVFVSLDREGDSEGDGASVSFFSLGENVVVSLEIPGDSDGTGDEELKSAGSAVDGAPVAIEPAGEAVSLANAVGDREGILLTFAVGSMVVSFNSVGTKVDSISIPFGGVGEDDEVSLELVGERDGAFVVFAEMSSPVAFKAGASSAVTSDLSRAKRSPMEPHKVSRESTLVGVTTRYRPTPNRSIRPPSVERSAKACRRYSLSLFSYSNLPSTTLNSSKLSLPSSSESDMIDVIMHSVRNGSSAPRVLLVRSRAAAMEDFVCEHTQASCRSSLAVAYALRMPPMSISSAPNLSHT